MTLPAASAFIGGSITEAQFKTAITELRAYLAALLGTDETNKVAALTALGALMNSGLAKTGAYTVVAADKGRVLRCDGTFTLSLTSAALLGDGFAFAVLNEGTGTITIDPNGGELIDGAATKAVSPGSLAITYCNGSTFTSIGNGSMQTRHVTDATDLLLEDVSSGQTSIGAAFSATIPPAGTIELQITGRLRTDWAGASQAFIGVRISGVNYWFNAYNINGDVSYVGSIATGSVLGDYREIATSAVGAPFLAANIAAIGLPVGSQTIQVIGARNAFSAGATLVGSVTPTRVIITIKASV